MISLAVPALLRRVPSWAWAILAALAAVFILWGVVDSYGDRRYREGFDRANAAWVAKIAADKAAQAKREAKASAVLIQQRQRDQVAADQRTKEISDATRHLPDQGLSARQRVRVCLELRRQGKAPPDCGNIRS